MNTQRIEQNGFRLVELVDDTSRTVVWKAVQNTLDRTVILRILKPEAAADPNEVKHFLSIARLFAKIKSESLAAVFDIVSEGDLHYVVMELVEGPTLESLVTTKGTLPVDQALRIAASLIASLDQMWNTARIVHRNLKSSTIRLDSRGVAKITDFSLAITAGTGVDATAMDGGHIVGTPCFLSPEQAQGAHLLTTQSDMYALGVVLYHLVTGRVPFEDRNVVSILAGHIKHQVPPPHHLNKHVSVNFSWFVHRLMMKNPNSRYADWDSVLHDIRLLLADAPPSCVRPDEEYLSTIRSDFEAAEGADAGDTDEDAAETPRVRLNRKGRGGRISAYKDKHLVDSHAREVRRDDMTRSVVCWSLLVCWLLLVFWFRAFYQLDSTRADTQQTLFQLTGTVGQQLADSIEDLKLLAGKEEASAPVIIEPSPQPANPPAPPPAAAQTNAPQALPPTAAPAPAEPKPAPLPPPAVTNALPAGIPDAVQQGLAQAFAAGDLAAARLCVKSAAQPFKEQAALQALLDEAPAPDDLVTEYLKTQIGRPLIFEHNGKQRTVIPRSVENGVVQLEANGRSAEFPLSKLSDDEKLRWMIRPRTPARCLAYCLTLMRSARRGELPESAAGCPLLTDIIVRAAGQVPPATPPAE